MTQSAWDLLWTPHRIAYIRGESRPADTDAGPQCPFCRAIPDPDAQADGAAAAGTGEALREDDPDPAGTRPAAGDGAEDTGQDRLVVARGEHTYVIMNLFPYNPGHVLLCPYRHVADFTDLTDGEMAELSWFQARMMRVIRAVSAPHGFNIGLNQGSAAGAGISGHLHQHIVPRWRGDSNYMTSVGGSRTMVMLLEESRDLFAQALGELP